MNGKRAAMFGSLVDIKNVNAHRCARLTIDVPAEHAAEIVAMFGWPTMADPVPVAVARMAGGWEKKETRSLAQQAGALCANAVFQIFLDCQSEEECANAVRGLCGVKSRSEIRAGTEAGEAWLDLVQRFHGWQEAERSGVEQ